MIGLDTNVLVRYLTQDDPEQAALATRVVERELTEDTPGFIGLVVLGRDCLGFAAAISGKCRGNSRDGD